MKLLTNQATPSKKASGPGDIRHIMLSNIAAEIAQPLLLLFNKSLQSGIFPSQWKHAHVLPIFKKGKQKTNS